MRDVRWMDTEKIHLGCFVFFLFFSTGSRNYDRKSATSGDGTRTLRFFFCFVLFFRVHYIILLPLLCSRILRERRDFYASGHDFRFPDEFRSNRHIEDRSDSESIWHRRTCTSGNSLARCKSRAVKWQSWRFCDVLPSYGKR